MAYQVKSGDTLSKIASQNGLTLKQLLDANSSFAPAGKRNPNLINVGENLKIPTTRAFATKPAGQPILMCPLSQELLLKKLQKFWRKRPTKKLTTISSEKIDSNGKESTKSSNTKESSKIDAIKFNDTAAKYATEKAEPSSISKCGEYVRKAIEATGIFIDRNALAKDFGPSLLKAGYSLVDDTTESNYQPKKGDIVVFDSYPGQSYQAGHIQIFNGEKFVSDFIQKDPLWPNSSESSEWKKYKPKFWVYRYS